MKILLYSVFYLLLLLVWIRIDFKLGRKQHLRQAHRRDFPFRHSDISLFTDGISLFKDMFSEIRAAEFHIHILFYIVKEDHFSKEFLSLLKEKAAQGVQVRLLLDWMGSFGLKKKTIRELRKYGIDISFCQVPKLPYLFYSSQERNHRKITVIDGEIAYLGGFNIGKEYVNEDKKLSPWRDYHLKISGEGVRDLQEEFLEDWFEATGKDYRKTNLFHLEPQKGKCKHLIVPYEGVFLEERYIKLIRMAKDKIIIGTPYFIPSKLLLSELCKALESGVNLTVIVPGKADHPFVKEASYKYFRKLIPKGAQVFQFQNGFYHPKILLVDNQLCDVGTSNFDKRSLFLNHELNCYIYDPDCISQLEKAIQNDLQNSTPLDLKQISDINPARTVKEWIASSISHFL
ncbi:cardiolipin synthase [Peribacillus deserti]|uniref:Cardiolipin synthase n=1 Tax=Peribacillus deserti TaxID=673318 RepID=A0A2N5MBF1_9BACI|nr:cardiolipin synthase [Peribacillus deserti]PLT31663.1 cardiolipin synthase [Peribacillus deserti]